MEQHSTTSGLPENAYKELKAGEEYRPIMDPEKSYPEVTFWSVAWGFSNGSSFFCSCSIFRIKNWSSI